MEIQTYGDLEEWQLQQAPIVVDGSSPITISNLNMLEDIRYKIRFSFILDAAGATDRAYYLLPNTNNSPSKKTVIHGFGDDGTTYAHDVFRDTHLMFARSGWNQTVGQVYGDVKLTRDNSGVLLLDGQSSFRNGDVSYKCNFDGYWNSNDNITDIQIQLSGGGINGKFWVYKQKPTYDDLVI
jgi:hypothetical protein